MVLDGYVICHKDIPVVSVSLNENYDIKKILKVHNKEHLPVGLRYEYFKKSELGNWLFDRGIPKDRKALPEILSVNNVNSREKLIIKNNGLGLTDCYWIKRENDNRKWSEVNFFDNDFSNKNENVYLGDVYGNENKEENINKDIIDISPNNLSGGMLPKVWIKKKEKTFLVKGSELPTLQEPFNELIVSKYLDELNTDHVPYKLLWKKNKPYSICPNMLKKNEEIVHAYYILKNEKKQNNVSYYEHYINQCIRLGLKEDIRKDLENMILIDYMTANTDRHWANFGVIRDADTLKVKRLAPLYDNGASLYAKLSILEIQNTAKSLECKSFKNNQEDNIKLAEDFSLLENKNLYSVMDIMEKHLNEKNIIGIERKNVIMKFIKQRINAACKRK